MIVVALSAPLPMISILFHLRLGSRRERISRSRDTLVSIGHSVSAAHFMVHGLKRCAAELIFFGRTAGGG